MIRVALLLLCAGIVAAQEQATVAEDVDAGREAAARGDRQAAIEHFARVRTRAPAAWQGHAYHALTLLDEAIQERDAVRRRGLIDEAARITANLVKKAGLGFTDPLYLYLRGVVAGVRGEDEQAHAQLAQALRQTGKMAAYEELPLEPRARQAFVDASVRVATRATMNGEFEAARAHLARARPLLGEGAAGLRIALEMQDAVVDERLGDVDGAVAHLEAAGDAGAPDVARARLVMLHLRHDRGDAAAAALAALPEKSRHPDVLSARAMVHWRAARKDPAGDAMARAIAFLDVTLKDFPRERVYELLGYYVDLVLAKVEPSAAADHRALVERAIARAREQVALRSACPGPYHALARLHGLLGQTDAQARYEEVFEKVKADWKDGAHFDALGRPLCGGSG